MRPASPFGLPRADMMASKAPISKNIEFIVNGWPLKKYALLVATEILAIVAAISPNQEKPSLSADVIRAIDPTGEMDVK